MAKYQGGQEILVGGPCRSCVFSHEAKTPRPEPPSHHSTSPPSFGPGGQVVTDTCVSAIFASHRGFSKNHPLRRPVWQEAPEYNIPWEGTRHGARWL